MGRRIRRVFGIFCLGVCLGFWAGECLADVPAQLPISIEEFRGLAAELSHKVNLFQAAWAVDSKAEFFGGTTRDYLYWLRGQFKGVLTAEAALLKMEELRKFDFIDAREFIIGDSDVDIVSQDLSLRSLEAVFKVRKVDFIDRDRFRSDTVQGQNELLQGYVPVEKIRLGSEGFIPWPGFGDGVLEIYEARPTVTFSRSEDFNKSYYATKGINHPVLLALRYLRIVAMNYYYQYGSGHPDLAILMDGDPASMEKARDVLADALKGRRLGQLLKNDQFKDWLNGIILKSYRSHTNPTATDKLHKAFGVELLLAKHSDKLVPTNQFLFAKPALPDEKIKERILAYGFQPSDIFKPPKTYFPDLLFFHGVRRDEAAYRSILLQGILPSSGGSAGRGLYGVSAKSLQFAINRAEGSDRVVKFPVRSEARIIDISSGKGEELFNRFGGSEDEFADYFGAQILKYDYGTTSAFVVKDSSALERGEGLTRKVIPFAEILAQAEKVSSGREAIALILNSGDWGFTSAEIKLLRPLLIDPFLTKSPPPFDSLEELMKFYSLSFYWSLGGGTQLALNRWVNPENLVGDFIQSKPSAQKVMEILLSPGRAGLLEPFRVKIKREALIPRLKEEAAGVKNWSQLLDFLPRLQLNILEPEDRIDVANAIGIPELHSQPEAKLVLAILQGMDIDAKVDGHALEKFLLALSVHSFLAHEPTHASNRAMIRGSKRTLRSASSKVFERFSYVASSSGVSIALKKLAFDLAALSEGNQRLKLNWMKTFEQRGLFQRDSSWLRFKKEGLGFLQGSLFVFIIFGAIWHGASLYEYHRIDLENLLPQVRAFGISSAVFFLLALISTWRSLNLPQKPIAHFAKTFSQAADIPCSARISRLADKYQRIIRRELKVDL